MKKLVIVESPAKVKTISKYLGKDYRVKASMGHFVDLPKKELGVDIDKKYSPKYVITKRKVMKELKDAFKDADTLVIASDPDREGEAIGWHVAQRLKVINKNGKKVSKDKDIKRIVFTSITKEAIEDAIKNPREIDIDLVDAQQARRILDRLVGYKLSPLIWKKIRYGLSAGRVQSVAVRLIVEREEEIEKFKAEEYWLVFGDVDTKEKKLNVKYKLNDDEDYDFKSIKFELSKISGKKPSVKTRSEVEKIIEEVRGKSWEISEYDIKDAFRYARPPFITSTLQQTAANKFGYSAKKTMSIAQKLYEAGHITYMRTDSLHIAPQIRKMIRNYIEKEHGQKYLNTKDVTFKTKSKNAQEAHEAIRVTKIDKNSNELKLKEEYKKLYDLIRARTIATQMAPAKLESINIGVDIQKYTFTATGQRIIFDGFLKVYPEKVAENILPEMEKGQTLYPRLLLGEQRFTKPPARYTEATLIKTLEKFEVGRPSTYASILSTIISRKYVEKEGRYLIPTTTGRVVDKLLVKYFKDIVDVGFTAEMEESLDEVAAGKKDWVKVIGEFYGPFIKDIEKGEKNISKEEFVIVGKSDEKCPECGSKMVQKLGRYGVFLSCSKFPKCKGMKSLDGETKEDIQAKAKSKEFLATYEPAPKTEDGKDYLLKKGRYGEFWAHPDYPKVKDIKSLKLLPEKFKEVYGEPPKTDDGKDYLLKRGRFGEFWAHPDYPKVKDIIKVKKNTSKKEE